MAEENAALRKMTDESAKVAEEYAVLRKKAEHNDVVNRQTTIILQVLRDTLSDTRKERDAALLENQNFKRKREGSTSPPPPQIKLLTRPQGATHDHQPAHSPARTEAPSSAQPAPKRSRNRTDRWANIPTTSVNVDGYVKETDPVLYSALTSFQHKAEIITQINASAGHLKLGRNSELVFHRTTVEDQAKVIKKGMHTLS
jgi:hypothetical protein